MLINRKEGSGYSKFNRYVYGKVVKDELESHGVKVLLNEKLERITGDWGLSKSNVKLND